MKKAGVLIFIFIFPFYIFGSGYSGADFLKINNSAKYAGSANSLIAFAEGADSMNLNPAGLGFLARREILYTHIEWFQDTGYECLNYGHRIMGKHNLGLSLIWLHHKPFDNYDLDGTRIGTLAPYDFAFKMGHGYHFKLGEVSYSIGANAFGIFRKLADYSKTSIGFDVGGIIQMRLLKLYPKGENENFRIGVSLQNIGTKIKFGDAAVPLPYTLRLGIGYIPFQFNNNSINLGVSYVNYLADKADSVNLGFDYGYNKILFLRMG